MKNNFTRIATTLVLSALFALPVDSFAQAGSLDITFDNDGMVTTPIGTTIDGGYAVAIQNDGKIVVAGIATIGSYYDFAAARYNTNGSLDTTFDTDGKVTTAIGSFNDYAYAIAIQSDGKIVLAGYSSNSLNADFAIVRYNINGSLDTTFDTDGIVTTPIGNSHDLATSVAIQSDGKIVLAGYSDNGTDNDFALARYNINGSLDTTFDYDGIVTTAFGTDADLGNAVAIQNDGKIVVAGTSLSFKYNFALVRYNTNGSLDTSFNADGKVTTAIGTSSDGANAIAIQVDGKIIVAGKSFNGSGYDFALARYNSNGSLDTTLNTDGKVTTPVGVSSDEARSVAVQSDGKIVAAGYRFVGSTSDFALVRYNMDGSLDTGFDTDGIVTTTVGTGGDMGNGVAIQSDGKIVVAGSASNGSSADFAIARYSNSNTTGIIAMENQISKIKIYPNPFSSSTTILFSLSKTENVTVKIVDVNERLIKILSVGKIASGEHVLEWNTIGLEEGIYFLRIETENYSENRKLIVTK